MQASDVNTSAGYESSAGDTYTSISLIATTVRVTDLMVNMFSVACYILCTFMIVTYTYTCMYTLYVYTCYNFHENDIQYQLYWSTILNKVSILTT